jgi:predicted transcriptional regulator
MIKPRPVTDRVLTAIRENSGITVAEIVAITKVKRDSIGGICNELITSGEIKKKWIGDRVVYFFVKEREDG